MNRKLHLWSHLPAYALGLAAFASCNDPTNFKPNSPVAPADASTGAAPPENCAASAEWIPSDGSAPPPQELFIPLPHPDTECPFYRGGWQNFLIATHADAAGEPAIKSYPTIDDVFVKFHPLAPGALAPPGKPRGTMLRSWLGDIKQAGGRQVLIDQRGHTLYYGIHVNQAFVDFVNQNQLTTLTAVQNADSKLFFPAGVVEFKSAWQDIDTSDGFTAAEQADYVQNYITTTAYVPTIHQNQTTKEISEDKDHPRPIKVALIAIHVVYAFPGHPEFIWTSFQHVDANGEPDSAPTFNVNPTEKDPYNTGNMNVVSTKDMPLYKGGTQANAANRAFTETDLHFSEVTQSFQERTPIYRTFPGSKSNTIVPDNAVTALNANVAALFKKNAPSDKRGHYRLVGGQWLDKPQIFTLNNRLQNDETNPLLATPDRPDLSQNDERKIALAMHATPAQDLIDNGSDSPFSVLAGEDRMSSTAMESFSQQPAPFQNCFACHNTQAVTSFGVPTDKDSVGKKLLEAKEINVSHVFSQFVLDECSDPAPPPTCP